MFFESFHSISEKEFYVSSGESISFPLHLHRSFELFIQCEGQTEVCIDEKVYHLGAGEAVLIFPMQIHAYRCVTEGKYEILIFSADLVTEFYGKVKNRLPVNNQMRCAPIAAEVADNLFSKKAIAYRICGLFDEGRVYEDSSGGSYHTVVVELLSYAGENFRTKCLLRDACAVVGYEYSYMSRVFKRSVGMSFRKYVNMLRIRESQHLFKTTQKLVMEIAQECGFGSLREFNRCFVSLVGCIPTEYRKRMSE